MLHLQVLSRHFCYATWNTSVANSACHACKTYERAGIQKLLYLVDRVLPTFHWLVDWVSPILYCLGDYVLPTLKPPTKEASPRTQQALLSSGLHVTYALLLSGQCLT